MNALIGYGSSSSSSSESDDGCNSQERQVDEPKPASKLPKPSLGTSSLQTSVFSNPYVEAELAKAAVLEKHVKMVAGKDNTAMINGKKICWNHRKGRCRFGHNCKFAHDTDIQKSQVELDAEKQKYKTVFCEGSGTMTSAPPPVLQEAVSSTDDALWEGGGDKRKLKRPGLSQTLVPGKKVLKLYNDQKNRHDKK